MATTLPMSLPTPPPTIPDAMSPQSCPSCGFNLPPAPDDIRSATALLEAQRKIATLEAQLELLEKKASAAVDKWADYEDEILKLRARADEKPHEEITTHNVPSPPPSATFPSRISAMLTRKTASNMAAAVKVPVLNTPPHPTGTLPIPPPTTSQSRPPSQEVIDALNNAAELAAALAREQSLRKKAENKFDSASREVEELSVSLFEQANEMVASERRARARLEERVGILEKRDSEKGKRLDRLESALERIRRARVVLEAGKAGT